MISFRYHIVSIVSVFLALAVGIALGGGPLQGEADDTLVDQVARDRQAKTRLSSRIAELGTADQFTDDFAATVAPGLVGGSLRGRVVTVVVLPTAEQSDVKALQALVGTAGGRVGGTARVGGALLDAGDKQLVEELGNRLEGRASGLDVPSDAAPYERIGALIGRAVGSDKRGGAAVDGAATSILAGLEAAGLMSTVDDLDRRGDLVLFVAGAGQGDRSARTGAATIVTSIVRSVDGVTGGTVLAGPMASADPGGPVRALREDIGAAKAVSTVDSLGRTAGQVVTIMALAGQAAGRTGQFGAVDAADGAMPGAEGSVD